MGVMSESEVRSRYEVELEKYNKLITIEARVMQRMTRRTYLPSINRYAAQVAVPAMEHLRACVDGLEVITDRTFWPAPSYNNMLFYV